MNNQFFEQPILNSPYEYPSQHWELDKSGQPTGEIKHSRRVADFITPIPKSKKQKRSAQEEFVFDEGLGLSNKNQQYDQTSILNDLRKHVDDWRTIPDSNKWRVTPETARLLKHWRHHDFQDIHVVNPDAPIFQVSATTGEGMDQWYDWLMERING